MDKTCQQNQRGKVGSRALAVYQSGQWQQPEVVVVRSDAAWDVWRTNQTRVTERVVSTRDTELVHSAPL